MRLAEKYTKNRSLIAGENDLLTWCNDPDNKKKGDTIKKEWMVDKNGDMSTYKPGSRRIVYWKCSICGAEYTKEIKERVMGKMHEPCGRKLGHEHLLQYHKDRIEFDKSLAGRFPDLLKEWDYTENKKLGLEPEHVSAFSGKKAHWTCSLCGRKYKKIIRQKAGQGVGCRRCANKKPTSEKKEDAIE